MSTFASLFSAIRLLVALQCLGLAVRLLPKHYAATFFALRHVADAILEDHVAGVEQRRR